MIVVTLLLSLFAGEAPRITVNAPVQRIAASGQCQTFDIRTTCGIQTDGRVTIESVASDDPNGRMAILGPTTVALQAARSKGVQGRRYSVEFSVEDARGNLSFDRCHFVIAGATSVGAGPAVSCLAGDDCRCE
jgi:hypothetical protein